MGKLAEIRTGIATALDTIPNLQVHRIVPASIATPAAWIVPTTIDYHDSFGGDEAYAVKVIIAASSADDQGGQDELDSFVAADGASSVRAVIEAAGTMGGVIQSAIVRRAENFGFVDVGGTSYYAAEFVVEIQTA